MTGFDDFNLKFLAFLSISLLMSILTSGPGLQVEQLYHNTEALHSRDA